MNGLQVFNYHEHEVRTVNQDGEPWWVLKDVCSVLGLKAPARVSACLDDDEKGVRILNTLGGEQEMAIINEPGLYSVILRSNKPEAKAFKRWITHEVLPSIRKTGRLGVCSGLSAAFREQEEQHQEWGLVMMVPQPVRKATTDLGKPSSYGEARTGGWRKRYADAGYQDGKEFDPGRRLAGQEAKKALK